MDAIFYAVPMIIAASGVFIGFFLFLRPASAIRIQKKFYEGINWKIEPISISKELRNTKLMGLFLLFMSFSVIGYILIKSLKFKL